MYKKAILFFDNWYNITSKWFFKIWKISSNTLIKITVADQIKILEEKIKANHVQNEAAKISVLRSKNLLDKYECLTGEDLGYKQNVFEKVKFEYSPLGMVLTNNTKSKTNRNTVISKKNKTNIWSTIHRIVLQSLKISMNLKNYHLSLCTKD